MSVVASRDLRNHTGEILRRVAAGERVTVTVNGEPVAELGPPPSARRPSITRRELVELLAAHPADPGLARDLAALTAQTTDDLDPPS